ETIYIRPDGDGKPGETRNWPAQKDHVNLPWNAMSFVLGDQRYTTAYLDKPTNPKEARCSEREYGRFGSYFVYEVTKEKPLAVNSLLLQVHIHRLDLGVVRQGIFAQFAADAAHLEAAKRGGRVEDVVAVDPHRPRPQAVGQPVGLLDVARPHGRGQAVEGLVA